MRRENSLPLLATLLLAAWLASCVTAPSAPPVSENAAVLALLDSARADTEAGKLPAATAELERALRIEPRNPMLWQELAQLHLRQGNYDQAESFAARSNSWAGANRPLRAANWRIIAEARAQRGNPIGAQEALKRANELER